jgi:uncharacterized protein (DUF1499 family)
MTGTAAIDLLDFVRTFEFEIDATGHSSLRARNHSRMDRRDVCRGRRRIIE